MNLRALQQLTEQDTPPKFVFFWSHRTPPGQLTAACFSQWYPAGFDLDGIHYPTAEHYMMAEKALLFEDDEIYDKILHTNHPGAAKRLGRQVRGFRDDVWRGERYDIVVRGNLAKFSQHDDLRDYLLGTNDRVLVEASPKDKIWGIGLPQDDPRARQPSQWRGLNLLGFALMEVREQLALDPPSADPS